MAPGTGHCSEQTVQALPWCGRQVTVSMRAMPIRFDTSSRKTSGSQALMQGKSRHIQHGCWMASIIGVPAARRNRGGAWMIAWWGQA
jgi:hypothetical protein